MTDQAYNIDFLVTLGVPGAGQTRALLKPIEDAPRAVRAHFVAATKEALRLDAALIKPTRKPQAVRVRPPDALRTPAEVARKPRRPSISKMIEQAEKAGTPLASLTLPDGTKLDFGKPEPVEADNPWPLDEFRTKETKQ